MHSKTLTGTIGPKYVVAGRDGTVYVADFGDGSHSNLYEYAKGSTTPTTTIPFATFPAGVALDTHNKLYVAYNDANYSDVEVLKFAPGKTKGKNLGISIKFGNAGGLAFDKRRRSAARRSKPAGRRRFSAGSDPAVKADQRL